MATIAENLQTIIDSKAAIRSAIENKGVPVGSAALAEYASKIASIVGEDPDGMNGFLSVESKTIPASATQTTNITYNKNCGIIDENHKKWDILDWHQRWVDNGYSATGLSKPIGIWMKAFGLDIVYLWPLSSNVGYSDVSGTASLSIGGLALFVYNVDAITAETEQDRTVWPCNQSDMIAHGTAGKYKSATWRSVDNGGGLDLVCDNTKETFTIPTRSVGNANAFMNDNGEAYTESHYQQCEFMRALFAVCSGIATNQPNGTKTTVEILNASGQQAAVGQDMYFWIGGVNTGFKAKYNLNSRPSRTANVTTANLSQTIADAIYNKQIANGVNMNDTGVNSEDIHVLSEGAKGAEAVAVDGYWYIKTPFISNCNGTKFNNTNNQADAPAAYICKARGVTMQTERRLYPYWLNKATHITSLVNLLRTTEGLDADVPAVVDNSSCWSAVRSNASSAWCVYMRSGSVSGSVAYNRYSVLPCPLASAALDT
jgi:hypothetical protein